MWTLKIIFRNKELFFEDIVCKKKIILYLHPLKGKINLLESIDPVAQLVEHYTFNVVALGSNPSGITKRPSNLMVFFFLPSPTFLIISRNI